MTKFSIPDMTCGHCKKTVEEAIHRVDATAKVEVDLDKHVASVASAIGAEQFVGALEQAGYPAQII